MVGIFSSIDLIGGIDMTGRQVDYLDLFLDVDTSASFTSFLRVLEEMTNQMGQRSRVPAT